MDEENRRIRYRILDPTGNITALVESPVAPDRQPAVAERLMARHREVEQVGFLTPAPEGAGVSAVLRMAGGEFCGNASLCAAALLLPAGAGESAALRLRVSGAAEPVAVSLTRETADRFSGFVVMPPALAVEEARFACGSLAGTLPVVRMEGISHVIVGESSLFFALLADRPAAERAVKDWCAQLGADGLGLMFLSGAEEEMRLTPLVYVPGSGTVFWENSCASGSAAVGRYLAKKSGAPVELALRQPGGTLRVACDPAGECRLYGSVRLLGEYEGV